MSGQAPNEKLIRKKLRVDEFRGKTMRSNTTNKRLLAASFALSAFLIFLIALPEIRSFASRTKIPILVPAITASKSVAFAPGGDVDGDGKADPGDKLQYSVTINNTGPDPATGVAFGDNLQIQTLVANSLNTSPIAANESFGVYGNVSISVPDGSSDLLANDFDPDGGAITLITTGSISSANCAGCNNVTINANGSFSYDPPVGFTGADSFTYTIRDNGADGVGGNADDATSTGTVTLNVSGMIWFVNNNAASCTTLTLASQCGKLSKPFSTLDAFNAVNDSGAGHPGANSDVFIYQSGTGYTLTSNLNMRSGERFIGQDASPNNTPINNAALLNITLPSFSQTLPSTDTANSTVAISGNTVTAISNNTLRGMILGNSATLTGNTFGTLTAADVTLNGTGQALNLTTGTLAATFTSISSTNSATTGISLTSVGGSLSTGTTTISNPTGIGISVNTSSGAFNFGNVSATASGGTGVSLTTNTGAITFGDLDISPDANQRGLLATDNTQTITATSGTIGTSGATGVEMSRASSTTPLAMALTSVSTAGGPNGIFLKNTSGSFSVNGDGTNTFQHSGIRSLEFT